MRAELAELREAGLTAYSLWLPVPTSQLAEALSWVAAEVLGRV
ncbi:hypothetical protein [Nocardia sp. BMG111209]|nr:hypothetical protein [Nocardia sp. BMG111209]